MVHERDKRLVQFLTRASGEAASSHGRLVATSNGPGQWKHSESEVSMLQYSG
jgi:hypothetical protein